ncbi:hypothetical protein Fmac_010727 [Flemingia macrophylla]|uniref:Cation efflux protein cytoplasmic domain-containing protein n=1 Tax=Flemingia macrophylla TaxID=520843 RepID=A0ABD1MKE8_9FABA
MVVLLGHDHGHGHRHNGFGHGHGHGHEHGHDGHGHRHRFSVSTHHDTKHTKDEHHHDEKHEEDANHHHTHDDHEHHHAHKELTEPLVGESKGGTKKKKQWNINIQGAYLHVHGDSTQIIILGTTINMLRNILEVLMESTPREIDATKRERGLFDMEDVVAVQELHMWAITVGKVLLACHVKIRREADADMVLDKVIDYIKRVYNISHVTIQIER